MQDNNGITGVAVPTTGSGAGRADPPAFDTSRAHQARVYDYLLKADGLRIEGPVEQFTARPAAIGPGELPDRIDFPVLVACKQLHTAAAAELLAGRRRQRRSSPRCRTGCLRPRWPLRRDQAGWSRPASTSVPTWWHRAW